MNVNRRSLNKKKKKKFIFEVYLRNGSTKPCSGPVRNKTNVNVNVHYIFSKFNFEMESRTGILLKKKGGRSLKNLVFFRSPFFFCMSQIIKLNVGRIYNSSKNINKICELERLSQKFVKKKSNILLCVNILLYTKRASQAAWFGELIKM